MARSDPYTRSYHRFADEFPEIYADDAAYALWCRLRDEADKAWPSSGPLPYGVKKRAMQRLIEAELVYPQPGHRYRIRGLDKERGRRSESARRNANERWDRVREQEAMDAAADADSMRSHSERNPTPMLAKPSQAEPSRAKPSRALSARDGLPNITAAVQAAGEAIAGAGVLTAGDKQLTELDRLVEAHGETAVIEAMQTSADGARRSWRQIVWDSMKLLEPLAPTKRRTDQDEIDDLARQTQREYEESRRG